MHLFRNGDVGDIVILMTEIGDRHWFLVKDVFKQFKVRVLQLEVFKVITEKWLDVYLFVLFIIVT